MVHNGGVGGWKWEGGGESWRSVWGGGKSKELYLNNNKIRKNKNKSIYMEKK